MVLETALGRIEQFDLMALLLLRRWQWKSRSHQLPEMNLCAEEMQYVLPSETTLEKIEQFDMMAPWMMAMEKSIGTLSYMKLPQYCFRFVP